MNQEHLRKHLEKLEKIYYRKLAVSTSIKAMLVEAEKEENNALDEWYDAIPDAWSHERRGR